MRELLNLMAERTVGDVLDVIVFFGRVIAGLGTLFQRPVKTRGEAGGADEARRLLIKRIVMQDAKHLGLNIGHAIKRIGEESARAGIQ